MMEMTLELSQEEATELYMAVLLTKKRKRAESKVMEIGPYRSTLLHEEHLLKSVQRKLESLAWPEV
jgi:hypothetical protein